MLLRDQFARDGGLDLRGYRNLLDAMGACENLPLALVGRTMGDDHLLVSSFSAPLFELLRARPWFREFERGQIQAALDGRGDRTREGFAWISYSSRLEGRLGAYLIPTPDPKVFVMCGPVWLRHPETLREPFTQQFVEDAANHIISLDRAARADSDQTDPPLSLERVRRTLQHRAAMSEADLLERVRQVYRTLGCFMRGLAPQALTADQIERVALAICFWNRRTELLEDHASGCPLVTHEVDQGDVSAAGELIFILSRSGDPDIPLQFRIEPRATAAVDEVLFLRSPVSEKWSFFSDTYRSNRNVFFLERILLIRLWLQDNFSGIAADNEIGGDDGQNLLGDLMRRLQRILGADACILYRYAPGETPEGPAPAGRPAGYLRRLAYHYVPGVGIERHAEYEAERMEQIGSDPVSRATSNSYRAIDGRQTEYNPDAKREDMYLVPGVLPPRTILSTPLISRGCIWGVIEIFGCDPHQFPYSNIRWVEELSRILTPILFDHFLTYRLREISRIAMIETPSRDGAVAGDEDGNKYELVLDHVRKLLMASSARLYLQQPNRTEEFVEKAHAGQAWPEATADRFSLYDTTSVSACAINRHAVWEFGTVGEGDFVEQGDRRPLEAARHIGCAIIPIYNGRDNCFATLMVLSTDNTFTSMWDSTVSAISKTLNVVFEAIHLQDTRVEILHNFYAHTLKTRTNLVEQGGQRLLTRLQPLLGDPEVMADIQSFVNDVEIMSSFSARHNGRTLSPANQAVLRALRTTFPSPTSSEGHQTSSITHLVEDLSLHLQTLRTAAIFIAGGPNLENPLEAGPDRFDGTWADLRLCLLSSLKPIEAITGARTQIRVPDRSVLPTGIKIRIPALILTEVFINLAENAMKYDFGGQSATLSVRGHIESKRYIVEFRNLAPRVSSDEAKRLRANRVYRSQYAKSRTQDGSGIGLRFIREQAAAWKFDFDYDPSVVRTIEDTSKMGWHSARLEFDVSVEAQFTKPGANRQ